MLFTIRAKVVLEVFEYSQSKVLWSSSSLLEHFSLGWPVEQLGCLIYVLRFVPLFTRGCNLCQDDAEDLNYVLIHMPNLTSLDLSDNPLEDEGIRYVHYWSGFILNLDIYLSDTCKTKLTSLLVSLEKCYRMLIVIIPFPLVSLSCSNFFSRSLIPYFVKAFEKASPISDVNLQNCSLSCKGVTEFLESSQTLREPLNSLSVAENNLSRQVGTLLVCADCVLSSVVVFNFIHQFE